MKRQKKQYMDSRKYALVALFTVQLLYGLNYTIAKTVMNENYIKPFGFVLLRVIGATVLFWLISFFFPKEKIEKKDYIKFVVAAIFGMVVNLLFFFKGLEYTSPIHASSIMTIIPVIILVLSSYFLKEKITSKKIIGIVIALCGALVLTIYGKSGRAGDNIPLGNFLILVNAISYSIYVILIKKLTEKYHPVTFIKWLFLIGLFMLIPFGYNELGEVQWQSFSPYITFSVIFVVVGATFGTYLLNPYALSQLKASTVGIFIYLQPVIAALYALAVGADFIDAIKIGAMVLIFTGVYLVTMKRKQKK